VSDPSKDGIDLALRDYLAPDMAEEDSEMVDAWVIVAVTSSVDGGGATHIIADRVLPRWQVKGVLTHALDVIREGE
jgi:hypothetical protein